MLKTGVLRKTSFWKKKNTIDEVQTPNVSTENDDFSDDGWSDGEFSDVESEEDPIEDGYPYNDIQLGIQKLPPNNRINPGYDIYENSDFEIVKTDEMRKTPPSLPPRKTDSFPKPPARRKKEKKPPLPEKIHTDHEDNQFYEEMNQMSLESSPHLPNKNMAMPSKKFQPKMNVSMRDDDGGYVHPILLKNFQDKPNEHQSIAPSVPPPPRKIPDLPAKTFDDMNPSYKTSRTHSSISNRPRIEPPKEKSTENPLNAFRWYHGDSERIVVEKKLLQYKRDGMFAVRTSKTKGPSYPYAVTLYQSGKTYNFPIRIRDSDKRFALGTEKTNEPSFESLAILIDYFKTNQIKLMNNQSALLNIPLDRSS